MDKAADTLVIGIGNLFRNDDAVGRLVARKLRGRLPGTINILECAGETTELMAAWEHTDCVLVIDALCSGEAVGKVSRIDASRHALPASLRQTSTHAFGLAEAIELARTLDVLPKQVIVFGVEAVDFEHGQNLSPAVQKAIDRCCELIEAELR